MSPKQQKMLMRRAGINFESVEDVREVIVRTGGADYVFVRPDVSIMVMQGQKTWQITGEPEKRPAGSAGQAVPGGTTPPEGDASPEISGEEESSAAPSIPAEDVALVAQQTGVSEEEARKALVECDGNPAEAIIRLMK